MTLFFHGNLYRGNRTTKINSGEFQAFDSPNLQPLATIEVKIDGKNDLVSLRISVTHSSQLHAGKKTPYSQFYLSILSSWACFNLAFADVSQLAETTCDKAMDNKF